MNPRLRRCLALALVLGACLACAAAPARAETRRIAVIVGSNRGLPTHLPLRYAEQDATKLSAVLAELGGVAAADVMLLRGPTLAELRGALDAASRRVERWHAERQGQAELIFYFSGHSDGQVLELGGDALPFSELRQRMTASGADVRLVIVDSCRSGALLALKGGTLGQAFDIRLADDLGSSGDVFIASSAADEAALESSEIGASFFSHHFISGLRGAADLSGDGMVTLAEAYQYAFAHTLRATSETLVGPQHPAYDYRLTGRGELVLTELRHPSAVLRLPTEFDRLLLVAEPREQVVAEIGPRSAHRIAVAPGDYELRGWRGGRAFGAHTKLAQGEELLVDGAMLQPLPASPVAAKGADPSPMVAVTAPPPARDLEWRRSWAASASAGLAGSIATGSTLVAARLGVERTVGPRQLALALVGATGSTLGFHESRIGAELLPSWWTHDGRFFAGVGAGIGGGVAWEQLGATGFHWSGLAWAAPTALLEVRIDRRWALRATVALPLTVARRDDGLVVAATATGLLGISTAL